MLPDTDTLAPHHSDDKPWHRWRAESNPLVIAVLGKTNEEANELGGIIGRIMCQGLDGFAPTREQDVRYNGESNIQSLMDEIADVRAWTTYTIDRLQLDRSYIRERTSRKYKKAVWWLGKPGS